MFSFEIMCVGSGCCCPNNMGLFGFATQPVRWMGFLLKSTAVMIMTTLLSLLRQGRVVSAGLAPCL